MNIYIYIYTYIYIWNSARCICENGKYLKTTIDDSVITCDEIIDATDSLSTNVINTMSANVTSLASINFYNKRVR